MISRVMRPLTGVDGKMSVGGEESNTKSFIGSITMIVALRILRMKKVGTTHRQILFGSRSIR